MINLPFPNKKYQIIYADCPWKYDFSVSHNRDIENQYPTMSLEEICSLQIPSDKNAVLYLWATAPKLLEALEVMKAWEFLYRTNFVWDKEKIGCGWWNRGQHELLLVATKGNFQPPLEENRESSIYSEKRTKHSKKPKHYYEWIKTAFPNAKKVELFARIKFDDTWEVWGNESI